MARIARCGLGEFVLRGVGMVLSQCILFWYVTVHRKTYTSPAVCLVSDDSKRLCVGLCVPLRSGHFQCSSEIVFL